MRNAEYYIISGNNKMLLGNYLGAVFDFTKAIMLNPDLPQPYTSRASAKIELHDYEGAIEDCTEAIRLHFRMDMESEGKSDLYSQDKFRRVNPIYAKIYSMLGTAKLILGNFDAALVDLNTARLLGNKDAVDLIKTYSR
jgi:tetratricopeptide (TPR) repeat protein